MNDNKSFNIHMMNLYECRKSVEHRTCYNDNQNCEYFSIRTYHRISSYVQVPIFDHIDTYLYSCIFIHILIYVYMYAEVIV